MKISQEVRDFAAKQEAGLLNSVRPELVEGHGTDFSVEEAEAGMARMSEVFRETGSELYMGTGDREHD